MDYPPLTRLGLLAALLIPATVLPACGSSEPQRSLDRALLPESQLPTRTPPLIREAHDASADAWVKVTTPDPADRRTVLTNLKDAGFERGSARQFRASGSGNPILALIEAVAQFKDSGAARSLVEQSSSRALKKARPLGGKAMDVGEIGEFSSALTARPAGVPVYSITWQRGDLVHYVALIANPNGGPGRQQAVELARRVDARHP